MPPTEWNYSKVEVLLQPRSTITISSRLFVMISQVILARSKIEVTIVLSLPEKQKRAILDTFYLYFDTRIRNRRIIKKTQSNHKNMSKDSIF